jgi:hypothetical protein
MVGVKINWSNNGFALSQPGLINKILRERWDGTTIKAMPLSEAFNSNFVDGEAGVNPSNFLSVIGMLNYISVGPRPDITSGVNCLARFLSRPSAEHWKSLNHLICYLAGTKERTLKIHPWQDEARPVECFTDANWGGQMLG